MALKMRMASEWKPRSMRRAKGSSEGPKTKIEKRNRLGGNAVARHIYTHPHAPRIYAREYARISALVLARYK